MQVIDDNHDDDDDDDDSNEPADSDSVSNSTAMDVTNTASSCVHGESTTKHNVQTTGHKGPTDPIGSSSDEDIDFNDNVEDPAKYCGKRIDNKIIGILLNKPCQPAANFVYPLTNGRYCLSLYFRRSLPDGTCQQRKWLSYSVSTDRLYCIHCILFGGPSNDMSLFVHPGVNVWHNAQRDLCSHESSLLHRTAESNR